MVISEINWLRHLTYEMFNGEEDLVENLCRFSNPLEYPLPMRGAVGVRPNVCPGPHTPAVPCQPVQGPVQGWFLVRDWTSRGEVDQNSSDSLCKLAI